jgi:predicted DNA-binding transcriptional regulator AlpA
MNDDCTIFVPPVDTAGAAELTGFAEKTLENMRSRGDGPPFLKLGRLVRYDPRDLEAWKAARRFNSTSEAA